VDRDHIGHWQAGNNSHAVQAIAVPNGVNGSMTYWNHYVYVLADSDKLRQFEVKDGKLSLKAASGNTFPRVSATPTVSANGSKDAIIWLVRWQGWTHPKDLRFCTLTTLRTSLMNSTIAGKIPGVTALASPSASTSR
jgi:hypothetical protein